MQAHLSQGNVLSWNDNLNSTQAQYLSCPPYLEMKGQNEVKALHACNLLDQCFSFCDLWTGKPWDKCIIPFSSQHITNKILVVQTDTNLWLPWWWLQSRDWQTRHRQPPLCSFSESWFSWTTELQTRLVLNSEGHQYAAVICLVSTTDLTTECSFFFSPKTFKSRKKTPELLQRLPKTGDKGSNILPWEIYLCIEILMTQGNVFSSLQWAAYRMEQAMLEILRKKTATTYSLQELLQHSGNDYSLGKETTVSYLNNCGSPQRIP